MKRWRIGRVRQKLEAIANRAGRMLLTYDELPKEVVMDIRAIELAARRSAAKLIPKEK